ncbi:hypothetical protein FACS1894182_13350 [Bacteroidia bacterium]|nr:hypothetical protein FACS1894182_13350 [Bacteroidia bacterium]
MQFLIKSDKIIKINNIKISFDFPIKTILDFDDCLVILLIPQEKDDIKQVEKNNKTNLLAINNKGQILWQISNIYIPEIRKVVHKTPLIILDETLKKEISNKFDLLIHLDKFNFYFNPKTGEKIREEQIEK